MTEDNIVEEKKVEVPGKEYKDHKSGSIEDANKTVGLLGVAGIMLSQIQVVITELGTFGLGILMLSTVYICTLAYLAKVSKNGTLIERVMELRKGKKEDETANVNTDTTV